MSGEAKSRGLGQGPGVDPREINPMSARRGISLILRASGTDRKKTDQAREDRCSGPRIGISTSITNGSPEKILLRWRIIS